MIDVGFVDRFDMGYYRLDMERAVAELRAELAKL